MDSGKRLHLIMPSMRVASKYPCHANPENQADTAAEQGGLRMYT